MPPVKEGWTRLLPGNSACYRREVIVAHRRCLSDGFWEAEFNRELRRSGCRMWMSERAGVVQRQYRGIGEFVPLRFHHGRCYGARRVSASPGKRGKLLAMSPLIPALLFSRVARAVFGKKKNRLRLLVTSPLVLVYILAWSSGEVAGYLFGAGGSCEETD